MSKKILCFAGDYVEDYEVRWEIQLACGILTDLQIMVPFQFLTALGYEVHVVSPGKKKNDKVRFDLQLFEFLFKKSPKNTEFNIVSS